jgi:hypothetical protein
VSLLDKEWFGWNIKNPGAIPVMSCPGDEIFGVEIR